MGRWVLAEGMAKSVLKTADTVAVSPAVDSVVVASSGHPMTEVVATSKGDAVAVPGRWTHSGPDCSLGCGLGTQVGQTGPWSELQIGQQVGRQAALGWVSAWCDPGHGQVGSVAVGQLVDIP